MTLLLHEQFQSSIVFAHLFAVIWTIQVSTYTIDDIMRKMAMGMICVRWSFCTKSIVCFIS
jgi:hypothetical protein